MHICFFYLDSFLNKLQKINNYINNKEAIIKKTRYESDRTDRNEDVLENKEKKSKQPQYMYRNSIIDYVIFAAIILR